MREVFKISPQVIFNPPTIPKDKYGLPTLPGKQNGESYSKKEILQEHKTFFKK